MKGRGTLRGLGLLALACVAASCARKAPDFAHVPDADAVADGGVRVEASAAEASTLNPILASDSASSDVCGLLFNGLVRYGPSLTLEGDLASSWEVGEGGRRIVFHLRRGVLWQDGVPFTSADVKFTVDEILDPKVASPLKSGFDLVASLETPDPWTVVVRYRKPFAPALEAWGAGILPEHLLRGSRDLNRDPFNRAPVGTGPYRLDQWKDKQYLVLKANPRYYEGDVHIASILVKFVPEPATQLLELKSGGIDGMVLQPEQYAHQTEDAAFTSRARRYRYPGLNEYSYLAFNLARPPFDDLRVRRALSLAIDRGALIQGVMQGLARPCSGPYSPLMEATIPASGRSPAT